MGHCYQIGRLLLTVCLPKSHTVSRAMFCPMTTRVVNQWVISKLFLVINITIVELSKQLLLSCNIHLRGLFALFEKENGRGRHLLIKCFHSCVLSKMILLSLSSFKVVKKKNNNNNNNITKPSFIPCPKNPLATIKFAILGNLNISVKVRVSGLIGTMFI